uniref:Peptidase S1 domain-containing protein n=1 Tax=Romanomermis culicivorax TaxID=13658 RepID=A0A915JZF0_ROMCU
MVDSAATICIYSLHTIRHWHLQATETLEGRDSFRVRRVYNGKEAVPHSAPWMGLLRRKRVSCGSFLISRLFNVTQGNEDTSSDIVLTAAHCIYLKQNSTTMLNASSIEIVFGKHKKFLNERNNFRVPNKVPLIQYVLKK